MALLMLTFKIAEELSTARIKVNCLQINGAKMSKDTLKKFSLKWKLIAMVQNLLFPPADFMAENYFQICTSEKFANVSGKLINHKLEIMQPSKQDEGSGTKPGELFGAKHYPKYADDKETSKKVWELCKELTGV
jgi:hypothetical protein